MESGTIRAGSGEEYCQANPTEVEKEEEKANECSTE